MLDPTSVQFLKTQRVHRSGLMVGQDRPIGRVTWAKGRLHGVTSNKVGVGTVRYLDKTAPEEELFGVRTIEIDRSIGQDAGTATITMYNTRPDWAAPQGIDTGGNLGYLSPTRGAKHPVPKVSVFNQLPDDEDVGTGLVGPLIIYPTSWNYSSNKYRDVLIPNTVLRTYQGYGSDNLDPFGNPWALTDPDYVAPDQDGQLTQTGEWLIDKVTFTHDGTVTIECRDRAKVLIEQYVYPPLVPLNRFPLVYRPAKVATGHKASIGKNVATFNSSSVDAAYGKNASLSGHRGSDAFDGKSHTFWLSGSSTTRNGLAWLQGNVKGSINEVVLDCPHGNYVVYVCVHENGAWQGTSEVTGTTNDGANSDNASGGFFYVITSGDTLWDLAGTYYGDNTMWPIIAKANNNIIADPHWIYPGQKIKIPYVKGTLSPPPGDVTGGGSSHVKIPYVIRATVAGSGKATIRLPKTYQANLVRVVFTQLYKRADGDFRADCATMIARNHLTDTYSPSTMGKASYITDWVEPIKEMLAWAGFGYFDPDQGPGDADTMEPDRLLGRTKSGSAWLHQYPATTYKNSIPLRVWGDFEWLGAGPVISTPGDYFMNKSFREAIQMIVDFIGGIFFIDEGGGAQFRLPNIWGGGNFINDPSAAVSVGAYIKSWPIEFHEDANLVDYSAVITDEELRSEVLVVGGYPNIKSNMPVAGGTVLGYNTKTNTTSAIDFTNVLAGQYRLTMVPGDATKLFKTEIECQRMAELIALFILFTYRQGTLTAPCHPGLNIDDQVRIYERVTGESYVHYVSSIRSSQDLDAGTWTMQCTTHWLGSDPNTDWFPKKAQLTPAVTELPAILARLGKTPPDSSSLPTG